MRMRMRAHARAHDIDRDVGMHMNTLQLPLPELAEHHAERLDEAQGCAGVQEEAAIAQPPKLEHHVALGSRAHGRHKHPSRARPGACTPLGGMLARGTELARTHTAAAASAAGAAP